MFILEAAQCWQDPHPDYCCNNLTHTPNVLELKYALEVLSQEASGTDKHYLHFFSVNWCSKHDLPTPISPMSRSKHMLMNITLSQTAHGRWIHHHTKVKNRWVFFHISLTDDDVFEDEVVVVRTPGGSHLQQQHVENNDINVSDACCLLVAIDSRQIWWRLFTTLQWDTPWKWIFKSHVPTVSSTFDSNKHGSLRK